MRVCLINPAWVFTSENDIILSHNLGLGYLAAFLREKGGHQMRIIDGLAEGFRQRRAQGNGTVQVGLTDKQIVEMVEDKVDLIGITAPFSHIAGVVEALCATFKKSGVTVPIVVGGVHPSTHPEGYGNSVADYWLVGEGERGLLALADGVEAEKIPGLLSKTRPKLSPGEKADQVEDLDAIPVPARDLLPMTAYAQLSPRRVSHCASSGIITSRGCPWDCEFCSIHPTYGYKWRKRSAENVLEEIRELVDRYEIRQLEFEDDNLTLDYDRAMAIFEGLCRLQEQTRVKLTWGTPNGVRAETVDRAMPELMKRSGCVRVTFALEHGDEQVRESMGKRLDLGKFERAVRGSIAAGLHVEVFCMVGYPGETAERFERARRYYRKLSGWGVHTLHFFYPQPYPGTRLYKRCKEAGYLVQDDYSLLGPVKIETEDFDTAEVIRRRELLLGEFDKTYRLRKRVKAVLGSSVIAALNRIVPRKAM